ncbi:MAG: hypothetical protein V4615_10030 [Bacteroidota bacterium]
MLVKDLPEGICNSKYLSETDREQIAKCERFPTEKELFQMRPVPEVVYILENYGHDFSLFEQEMHLLAKQQIEEGNEWFAFKLLMVVEYTRESLV